MNALGLILLLCIPTAWANVGVPMLTFELPILVLLLPLIVLIEARVYKNRLGTSFWIAIKESLWSNLLSTFIGVPITWAILAVLEIAVGAGGFLFDSLDTLWAKLVTIVVQSPWLVPFGQELYWLIPAAGIFLLIPFFFASWWVEYWNIARRVRKGVVHLQLATLRSAVGVANLQSYLLLLIAWLIFGAFSLIAGYPETAKAYLGVEVYEFLSTLGK